MPQTELRTDPWTGQQIIVAGHRASRPHGVSRQTEASTDEREIATDPFLEGRERETPEEIFALRSIGSQPDTPGWLLRIVENRYPAVSSLETSAPNAARGFHDVVIECPDFRRSWEQFSVAEVVRVLIAWQRRIEVLNQSSQISSIQVFRNQGAAAGASLGHSHSQIVALHDQPNLVTRRLQNASRFFEWREQEQQQESRIVHQTDDLFVVCPLAGIVAGQIRVCPLDPVDRVVGFCNLSFDQLGRLATVLKQCVSAIVTTFPGAAFNIVLNLPPVRHQHAFCWSIDIMPRRSSFAGFELGCQVPIITTRPEDASDRYRGVWNSGLTSEVVTARDACPETYQWTS